MINSKIVSGMYKVLLSVDKEDANLFKVASLLIKQNIALTKKVDNLQEQIKLTNKKIDMLNKANPDFGSAFDFLFGKGF